MSARASPVRACTRSSGGVASAKCSTRSPASQAAVSSGRFALSSVRAVVAGHVGERRPLGGAKPADGTVCLSSPAASGHGARSRRRAVAGTARRPRQSSSSVAGPLLPRSDRGWLAPNSQAKENAQQDLARDGHAPARSAKETRAGGSTQIGATPARRRDSRTGRVGSSGAAFLTSLAQRGWTIETATRPAATCGCRR